MGKTDRQRAVPAENFFEVLHIAEKWATILTISCLSFLQITTIVTKSNSTYSCLQTMKNRRTEGPGVMK